MHEGVVLCTCIGYCECTWHMLRCPWKRPRSCECRERLGGRVPCRGKQDLGLRGTPKSLGGGWLPPAPPLLPDPPPSELAICIPYVKEILLSPLCSHLLSGNWSDINFCVAGSCWESGDAVAIGFSFLR